jgi:hypothetical protein
LATAEELSKKIALAEMPKNKKAKKNTTNKIQPGPMRSRKQP